MTDPVVLSFNDSLLRKSDVELLNDAQWLNDNIIGFAFEYFEKHQFLEFSKDFAFVSPEVTQCIKLVNAEDTAMLVEPLGLTEKKMIFFAVNDNVSLTRSGGSHWSLLVVNTSDKKCFHYDSLNNSNLETARQLCRILKPLFGDGLKLQTVQSPQQTNTCDCGLYVICTTEELCNQHIHPERRKKPLEETLTPSVVSSKRKSLRCLIDELSEINSKK